MRLASTLLKHMQSGKDDDGSADRADRFIQRLRAIAAAARSGGRPTTKPRQPLFGAHRSA